VEEKRGPNIGGTGKRDPAQCTFQGRRPGAAWDFPSGQWGGTEWGGAGYFGEKKEGAFRRRELSVGPGGGMEDSTSRGYGGWRGNGAAKKNHGARSVGQGNLLEKGKKWQTGRGYQATLTEGRCLSQKTDEGGKSFPP